MMSRASEFMATFTKSPEMKQGYVQWMSENSEAHRAEGISGFARTQGYDFTKDELKTAMIEEFRNRSGLDQAISDEDTTRTLNVTVLGEDITTLTVDSFGC